MELWCGSDGAAFASKLAVCLITSTPPLTGLKPAYDENCRKLPWHKIAHKRIKYYAVQQNTSSITDFQDAMDDLSAAGFYAQGAILRVVANENKTGPASLEASPSKKNNENLDNYKPNNPYNLSHLT